MGNLILLVSSSVDATILILAIITVFLVAISFLLKKIKQTFIIGYILTGILLGNHGLNLITNKDSINLIGELGVILLLFFIGMEIDIRDFVKRWRVSLIGTLAQISASVIIVLGLGYFFNWSIARSVVIGFVIALSSSAVVIKLLQDKNLIDDNVGKNVISILLAQDVAFVPLLLIISLLGGEAISTSRIILMLCGAVLIISLLIYIYKKDIISFSLSKKINNDHELQVFIAIALCFGGAVLTLLFGLSAALGAFVGGIIINAARETNWIHDTLHSFRVLFVAFFFISVGLQMDLNFLYQNLSTITIVLLAVFLSNHLLNTLILRFFSTNWKEAILGGALLAQIGELSFLLSSNALTLGIIEEFTYNFTISLISLTLVISPFWIIITEKIIGKNAP